MADYIKSPLNYTGGKYKLLPQILPLFPEKINTFWDMFGGGFNVGINVEANKIIYNELLPELVYMFRYFKYRGIDKLLYETDIVMKKFELNEKNKNGYLELRRDYNESEEPFVNFETELYVLICHSFCNQIRFNKKGQFNMPFGKRTFNEEMKKNFIRFVKELQRKNITFSLWSATELPILRFGKDDLFYCDPPYLNSTATYNEQGRWKDEDEIKLLKWLDELDNKGIKFALSNNLKYENPYLKQWITENEGRYKVHYLKADYGNCNYQKKDKSKDCEVLVVNY